MKRAVWLWVGLAGLITGCPPPIDTGGDAGATGPFTVFPQGGEFVRDGVYFKFPKGAVTSEEGTTITVTVIDTGVPEVPNRKRISYGYRLSPSNLVFKQQVTVTFTWLPDRVPQGLTPDSFDMRRSQGTEAYLELGGRQIIELGELKAVQSTTDRLGLFWLTSPAQPAVSKIELSPDQASLKVGETQQFSATLTDPAGNPIADVPITWSVVAPRVAAVDGSGLLTAKDPGIATLTATAAGVFASAPIRVQGSTKGPTTFLHDNPFPTGNDLWGGALVGGQAVFVGGNGTVLTRSAASDWARLFSAPLVTFKAAAGSFPQSGVAVGTSINQGVLVEVSAANPTPALKTFASSQPRAVWFDGTHGMAVGDGNDVLIRRAGQWVTEYSPSFESLMSVLGDGAGGFVTVGNLGSIYQYDPAAKLWNSLYQTRLSVLLQAGAIVSPNGSEAWAAGGGKLWRFQSNTWSAINLPASPAVTAFHALGVIDGRIVLSGSSAGVGHLLLYEPTSQTWTSTTVRAQQIIRGIFGAGAQGWAVGDNGAVWEYQGGTFVERSRGLYGQVADLAATDDLLIAAMNVCANTACTQVSPKVLQRTAAGEYQDVGTANFTAPLVAVALRSAGEIYAATASSLHVWNGTAWSRVGHGSAQVAFRDLTLCGQNLWAVGDDGAMYKGTGSGIIGAVASSASSTTKDLYALHCATPDDVWAVGAGVMLQNRQSRSTQGVNHAAWLSVYSPGKGEAYALGDARYGVYWDTTRLNVLDQLGGLSPDVVTSQWASTPDNHYAVGFASFPVRFSFALRSDGAQFTAIDPGTERTPTVVTGSSNTNVWLGDERGGILRGVNPP